MAVCPSPLSLLDNPYGIALSRHPPACDCTEGETGEAGARREWLALGWLLADSQSRGTEEKPANACNMQGPRVESP